MPIADKLIREKNNAEMGNAMYNSATACRVYFRYISNALRMLMKEQQRDMNERINLIYTSHKQIAMLCR